MKGKEIYELMHKLADKHQAFFIVVDGEDEQPVGGLHGGGLMIKALIKGFIAESPEGGELIMEALVESKFEEFLIRMKVEEQKRKGKID